MGYLIINQKGPQGISKTWRIRQTDRTYCLGQSKHADLRSPIESLKGIQGLFEYRDGNWYYLNLDLDDEVHNKISEVCLDKPFTLNLGSYDLIITPLDNKSKLFSIEETVEMYQGSQGKQAYQIYSVYSNETLLETKILPFKKVFVSKFDPVRNKISAVQTSSWAYTELPDLKIAQRTVYLDSVSFLKSLSKDQIVDSGGKKTLLATVCAAILLALAFLLSPNSKDAGEMAKNSLPPIEYKEVTLETPKKKVVKKEKPPVPQEAKTSPSLAVPAPTENANNKAAKAEPAKSLSAIKSIGSSRISQLIGKISASSARSKNIIVQNGIAAGSAPSGRALSSLGKVTQEGKDWTKAADLNDIKISTNGLAGGKGVNGLGSLNAGKAGTGGVGLLEDESEVVGGLDRDVIAQYIKTQLGQILYCYERQLSANPELYGKVSVRFIISGSGEIDSQQVKETSLKNTTVESCILQRVSKWKFPKPSGGTKVVVTYPFLFKSTN